MPMKTGWLRSIVSVSLLIIPFIACADSVAIVNPTNGATFIRPVNVLLQAAVASNTTSTSNSILRVNFYTGPTVSLTTLIGSQMTPHAGGLYDVTWTNPPVG